MTGYSESMGAEPSPEFGTSPAPLSDIDPGFNPDATLEFGNSPEPGTLGSGYQDAPPTTYPAEAPAPEAGAAATGSGSDLNWYASPSAEATESGTEYAYADSSSMDGAEFANPAVVSKSPRAR